MDSRAKGASSSRIYVNFLPHLEEQNFSVAISSLKNKLADFISRESASLLARRVDEIEIRVRVGKEKVPLRLMATSMSGQWLKVDMYKEYLEPTTGKAEQFCMLGPNGEEQACFLEPYPQPGALQQKRAVARAIGTTYIFDFLGLFEKALVLDWRAHVADVGGTMPSEFFSASELVLGEDGVLTKEQRPAGSNNVGMVGWHCFMKTPEYPQGREIVIVGNDCTYMSGSFGVKEDDVYDAVSKYARNLGLPRVYIASNSGARIGLVEELKPYFKIAWIDDSNPGMGFKYLYLTPDDYKVFPEGTVAAEEIVEGGETRMKLTDIIGQIHGIGVENLRGSGMIAGEQSAAYADAFTLSYVTGRSVGIGAYLCRLGQRNIQMTNGPLILTGYLALNKLLGREVYTSQDQLGGPQVMMPNGVSHLQVSDDQEGVRSILKWLSYTPATSKSQAPALRTSDPVDRDIEFMPTKTPYDPRNMLAGVQSNGAFAKGFFDVNSWTETLPDWGKSVVTGRARLGGIPCGVIAVETRLMEQRIPADPANPESREAVLAQAGQVWFPDSAHKTATAIRDFNNAENLPLFIFANWRGFSGGTRDMYGEILKFGAMIVDELRVYRHPVFVYIPPNGELRGGAWVVVDPTINEAKMEMYADKESRGGILEPPGICEVKFRSKDQIAAMHRLDPILANLAEDPEKNKDEIKKREANLLPMYTQVAHEFADLHDRSGRMKAKGVIRDVVEWQNARRYFHGRLTRRLAVDALASRIKEQLGDVELDKSVEALVEDAIAASGVNANDDRAVAALLENSSDKVMADVMVKGRAAQVAQFVSELKGLDAEALSAILAQM
jgi:acetyl-CoA carboxylase/biotin carboxylase 1